jgi:hypothetical protein
MKAKRLRGLVPVGAALAVVLAVTACGSSHSSTASDATKTATALATAPTTTAAPAPPARVPQLRILAPHRGAVVARNLTVRVSVTGATPVGRRALKYVLDGSLTRVGSARLTYQGLAPGDHHLLVALVSRPSVRASVSFNVPAPAPPPTAAPATTSSAPASTPPTPTPPPAPSTMQAPAPPPPAPSGGIPQGPNAGDADSDNHGGPSDGDGNI